MRSLSFLVVPLLVLQACNCGEGAAVEPEDAGRKIRPDADEEVVIVAPVDAGTAVGGDAGLCNNPADLQGCPCSPPTSKRPCYTSLPATRGKGLCEDGTQVCNANGELGFWGPCQGEKGPAAEVCADKLRDHDCDGLVGCNDPSCATDAVCRPGGPCSDPTNLAGCPCDVLGGTRACYGAAASTRKVGACQDGAQTCVKSGELLTWSACTGGVTPIAEACAGGVDDDCDSATDCADSDCKTFQACVPECQAGATAPCYTGPSGTSGTGICRPGTKTCQPNAKWGACTGDVLPGTEGGLFSTTNCHDSLDNDCDGLTDCDELLCSGDASCTPNVCTANETRACYSGPAGTRGVGACKDGSQTCAADGKSWGACSGDTKPVAEGGLCSDSLDNDCNGKADCADSACATAKACCTPNTGTVDMTIWAHSATSLYQVDPTTFATTYVGDFGTDQMTDLAVTPNGTIYTVSFTALYRVDKATAKATYVAPVSGTSNNGLTFLPDGTLLASDQSGAVKLIDPNNGTVSAVGNFGNGLSSSGDLVAVQGTMYGISSTNAGGSDATSNNVLLRVDDATGVATPVGPIGFGGVWGLAYVKGRVIAFTSGGQIIEVDPQTGKGTALATKNVDWWGAGMSPLTPVNPCP